MMMQLEPGRNTWLVEKVVARQRNEQLIFLYHVFANCTLTFISKLLVCDQCAR